MEGEIGLKFVRSIETDRGRRGMALSCVSDNQGNETLVDRSIADTGIEISRGYSSERP